MNCDGSGCTLPSLVQISTRTIRRPYGKSMIRLGIQHIPGCLCHHGWSAVISTSDDRPSPVPSAPRHDNVQLAALPLKTPEGGRLVAVVQAAATRNPSAGPGWSWQGEKGGFSASDWPESPTQGHLIFPVA